MCTVARTYSLNTRAAHLVVRVRRVIQDLPDPLLGIAVAELEESVSLLEALMGPEGDGGEPGVVAVECGCEVAA